MATKETHSKTPLDTGGDVFELLEKPRKAWIYTYINHHPETTIQDIVDSLDLPQRTVYDYVDDLVAADFIEQSNDGRPTEYRAHEIDLRLVTGDVERQITSELVEAIARQRQDGDIETYIDRHGLDGLSVALDYAREYADGSVTHRIMAREQDLSAMEAGVILDALRPVVEE